MFRESDLDMEGVTFDYAENPGGKVYDPCYGVQHPDGKVVIYPNVNGSPAFLQGENRIDGPESPAKGFVFDTKITKMVMEHAGVDVNVWSKHERKWVTQ